MTKYRIQFRKMSRARFMSHLDMIHMFERACRRAEIPLAYSEGFNPHPDLVFNAPLPLGMTSESEFVDVGLTVSEPVDLVGLLNPMLPEGIELIKCVQKSLPLKPVMATVTQAKYIVLAEFKNISVEMFLKILDSKESLVTKKKSKSGIKDVDVRPLVYAYDAANVDDGALVSIKLTLASGNDNNLRPDTLLRAVSEHTGCEIRLVSAHKICYLNSSDKIIDVN